MRADIVASDVRVADKDVHDASGTDGVIVHASCQPVTQMVSKSVNRVDEIFRDWCGGEMQQQQQRQCLHQSKITQPSSNLVFSKFGDTTSEAGLSGGEELRARYPVTATMNPGIESQRKYGVTKFSAMKAQRGVCGDEFSEPNSGGIPCSEVKYDEEHSLEKC